MIRLALLFALVAPLGACTPEAEDEGPPAISADEARALDEAAEMIEADKLPPDLVEEPAAPTASTDTAEAAQ